jgi:hypothetical protein
MPTDLFCIMYLFYPSVESWSDVFFATVQNFAHKKTNGLDESILGIILIAVEYWIYFSVWSNFV